jgi:hypothetical protein
MWNLERTERLITRLVPLIIIAALLALALMSLRHDPARLSPAFGGVAPAATGRP